MFDIHRTLQGDLDSSVVMRQETLKQAIEIVADDMMHRIMTNQTGVRWEIINTTSLKSIAWVQV